jgi:hypothetical protein
MDKMKKISAALFILAAILSTSPAVAGSKTIVNIGPGYDIVYETTDDGQIETKTVIEVGRGIAIEWNDDGSSNVIIDLGDDRECD